MTPIRVLVTDDAVVVRRLLTQLVEEDPELVVAGSAAHGRIALAKIPQVNPDVVVLDVEMPEMDGLETLKEIRRTHPALPVIMFSTLTERGAATTLDALALGANDFVTKPANVGSVGEAMQRVREELIPKIKALAEAARGPGKHSAARRHTPPRPDRDRGVTPAPAPGSPANPRRFAPRLRPDIVVIGSSTGGPNALAEVLTALPGSLAAPVLVTQHMPPLFTRLLAERLNTITPFAVAEAHDGATIEPGQVWVAAGDHHLTVRREGNRVSLVLNQEPPENSCRPAVDVMFRSAVATYGPRTLGVVLTGMGQDGLRGAEQIVAAGGRVIAQDEASSVVWGMPGFVARNGLADAVLPLGDIAAEISGRFGPLSALFARPASPAASSGGRR